MRMALPSVAGLSPRLALRIAFSMVAVSDGSNGVATMSVG